MKSLKEQLYKTILCTDPSKGPRFAEVEPLQIDVSLEHTDIFWNYLDEYDVSVKFGRSIACKPDELENMKRIVYEEVMHYVYGDLRQRLYKLFTPLSRGDRKESVRLLEEILREISP